ncbi:MAG: hypothetical protein ACFE0S_10240 [Rhodospirillales bacterium]
MSKTYSFLTPKPGFDAYEPQTFDDVKRSFIANGDAALAALKEGDLPDEKRAGWLRVKSGKFGVKPGYGKNNAFVPAVGYLHREYQACDTVGEAIEVASEMLQAAEDGFFDDGLQRVFDSHQEMVAKRQDGMERYRQQHFRANTAPEPSTASFKPEFAAAE